jgi:hypothetical protein
MQFRQRAKRLYFHTTTQIIFFALIALNFAANIAEAEVKGVGFRV